MSDWPGEAIPVAAGRPPKRPFWPSSGQVRQFPVTVSTHSFYPPLIRQPVMPQEKRRLQSEVDRTFSLALEQIRDRAHNSGRAAAKEINSKFDENVFGRTFFQDRFKTPDIRTTIKQKLALIAAHRIPSEQSIAEIIFRRIVKDDQSLSLTKKYDGFYRYWRHYPHEHRSRFLRWGIIRLETIQNLYTVFSHWSHDEILRRRYNKEWSATSLDRFQDPEDTGFAFYSQAKLFALGFREGNIRLTIADVPAGRQEDAIYTGIVLTTKKHGGSNIFAAGFIMVHVSNNIFWKTHFKPTWNGSSFTHK
jgi:hypothetical protein